MYYVVCVYVYIDIDIDIVGEGGRDRWQGDDG